MLFTKTYIFLLEPIILLCFKGKLIVFVILTCFQWKNTLFGNIVKQYTFFYKYAHLFAKTWKICETVKYRSLETIYRSLETFYRSLETFYRSLETYCRSLETYYRSLETYYRSLELCSACFFNILQEKKWKNPMFWLFITFI